MATDYDHANEALQDDAGKVSNAAHKGVHAAKTAKKTFGKLKKGVDAVSNNPVVLLQKVKIALYIFAAIVIIACVSMIPSIISNIFLHQSDPAELSAKSDFLEFENDDELETSLKEVYDDDRNAFYKDVQKDAYREAQDDLLATAPAGYVIDPWKGDSLEKMPDEDMVLLCSAYNACNSNALDDFMFEEYQETTSTDDFIKICKTLLEKPNAEYPNGNALYGTDWVRDAAGNIYVYEVVAGYDADGNPIIEEHIIPQIYLAETQDIIQAAWEIDDIFSDLFDEENDGYTVYADVIYESACLLSETLWKDNADSITQKIQQSIGFSSGSAGFGYNYGSDSIGVNYDWVGPTDGYPDIVRVAEAELGNSGGKYQKYTGLGANDAWCAAFVSWCVGQTGQYETGAFTSKQVSCSRFIKDFKDKGQWVLRADAGIPKAGYLIFFDWPPQDGVVDHVGIVSSAHDGEIFTIEGNSGNRHIVRSKHYSLSSSYIVGYCTPNYK